MDYTMTTPCESCPFRVGPKAVRLSCIRRADEIADSEGTFPCHKTTTAGGADGKNEVHCAGFLILQEKRGSPNQMMRIAGRLGLYDPSRLNPASFDEVIDEADEMVEQ